MAKQARIEASIWLDPEFLSLPAAAQRLYLLILSQGDISMAGTLAVRAQRWAALANDTSPTDVVAALGPLELRSFIVVDHEYGELWVRAWIRRNDVVKPRSTVVKAFDNAAANIMSPKIRSALVVELERELAQLPGDGGRERLVGRLSGWLRDSVPGGIGPSQLQLLGAGGEAVETLADAYAGRAHVPSESAGQGSGDAPSDGACHGASDGASRAGIVFRPSSFINHPSPQTPAVGSTEPPQAGVGDLRSLVASAVQLMAERAVDADIAGGYRPRSRDAIVAKHRRELTLAHGVELSDLARRGSAGPAELVDRWTERQAWPGALEAARRYGERVAEMGYRGIELVQHLRDEFGGSVRSTWSRGRRVSIDLARAQRRVALLAAIEARGGPSPFAGALLERLGVAMEVRA